MWNFMGKSLLIGFLIVVMINGLVFISVVHFGAAQSDNTILFSDGFESGDYSAWSGGHGACSISTVNPYSGTYCSLANGISNSYINTPYLGEHQFLNASIWVNFKQYPYNSSVLPDNQIFVVGAGNAMIAALGLYPTGNSNPYCWSLGYSDGGWGFGLTSTQQENPSLNMWYFLTLTVNCSTTNAEYRCYVNGVELTDLHITGANSVISTADYVEYADSDIIQAYDDATVSTTSSSPTPTPTPAIIDIKVVNGGTGYTTPAILLKGGGGTGATATARVSNGVITGIVLTNPGSGYTSAPTIDIRDPNPRAKGATAIVN